MGTLQPGQRIGAWIGAALLVTVHELLVDSRSDDTALRWAPLVGAALLTLALPMAARATRQART